jgi:hypothetical protein
LSYFFSIFPDAARNTRLRQFVNQFVVPAGLVLLGVLAYKFWA